MQLKKSSIRVRYGANTLRTKTLLKAFGITRGMPRSAAEWSWLLFDLTNSYKRIIKDYHPDTHPDKKEEAVFLISTFNLLKKRINYRIKTLTFGAILIR